MSYEIECPYCGSPDVESIGSGMFFCNGCNEEFSVDEVDFDGYTQPRRPAHQVQRIPVNNNTQQDPMATALGCAVLLLVAFGLFLMCS